MQPIIVHISNDFPDIVNPHKTKAIQNLVDGTPEFRHIVYSLNRVTGWKGISTTSFGTDRTAITYKALPKGLFWPQRLHEVGEWIEADLHQRGIIPDLIQGHKLTIEGLIARQLASTFKKPFVCSIQGGTDARILKMKPSLRTRFQDITDHAAVLFTFSVWPLPIFRRYLRLQDDKVTVLPVIPNVDTLSPAPVIAEPRLLSVFHLDGWKRKNFPRLLQAVKAMVQEFPKLTLDVYGTGSSSTLTIFRKKIVALGLENHVRLMGAAPNGDIPQIMKQYAGFILPGKDETYGLVFVEALFSGVPVLFSKGFGIDGFFDTAKIGYSANPYDSKDIAKGIRHLLTYQAELKASIAKLQKNGAFDLIKKDVILETYRKGLRAVLTGA